METKETNTIDIATTILGIIVVLWVMFMATWSMMNPEIIFDWKYCTGFTALGVFLIWFKGDQARALFEKAISKRFNNSKDK